MSAAPALDGMMAIPSLDLTSEGALPFDLFVRLPITNRVILYRRSGSSIEQEKIDKVAARQLRFFVQRKDYSKYLEFATREFIHLIVGPPVDPERMKQGASRVLSSAFSQESVAEAREVIHNLGDLVTRFVSEATSEGFVNRQTLFVKFAQLAQAGTDFQRHPLHVASLTVMLAVGLGIHDQRSLVEIGLAGVLHDVGLTQLPMSVISEAHKYRDLGTVSKALLKLHPQSSVDLLHHRGIPVSKLMQAMILQHHEEYGGEGYPSGLVGEAVHPLAQVLHVADDLDDMLTDNGPTTLENRVRRLFERYGRENTISPTLRLKLHALLIG